MDENQPIADSASMTIVEPYRLYIERVDQTRNVARFYAMSIEPTLFGETALTRRWGRIGSTGREMVCHFDREKDAVVLFLYLLREKRIRGYKPFVSASGVIECT